MCRSRSDALAASAPSRRSSARSGAAATTTFSSSSSSSHPKEAASFSTASASTASSASLAAARASLPDPPVLYPFQELAAATNNFLARRAPASVYWRCTLRGRDAALFQLRALRSDALRPKSLAATARYHHTSLAPLLGACLAGAHVYLAYELPPGAATLAACLRSPRNPSFTALRTWLSRVQVAADVAQGLEYIHHHADAVHGRLSPSTVLVSDPGLRARLTHTGATQFAEMEEGDGGSREADVRAFGLLLLELLSGEQATTYRLESSTEAVQVSSVVETAAAARGSGRVRSWVDRRLGDSFPLSVAERLLEVGLRCAAAAAEERPNMTWVAGKVSKAYLESRAWEQTMRPAAELSVTLAPR
ncbi:hypothetical protein GUJ93_ZPchr0009g1619 [Zizania palustris]|uniref:Protein kinase domain-containing protein n=1 Tax=Zizania palustris TaxID=103762 RepID=A0A8J5RVN8_ZIZPA|nr:hypothetical protein GUJ93_ZPchr0009g1619 [Zizania palustris]